MTVPFSMTLSDPALGFQGCSIFFLYQICQNGAW